jgi:signal peptidase II
MKDSLSKHSLSGVSVSYTVLGIGLLILLLDQLSKGLVSHYLPVLDAFLYWYPYGGIGVFKDVGGIEFSINHMTNTGAAWGAFSHYQVPLIVLRMGLIMGLLIYLFYFNRHPLWQIPLLMIIAGAIGNVLDFFIYGHVVDMFHFVFWGMDFPVFNVADSAISIGIGALFFLNGFPFGEKSR